jgi:hypothetical protein
MEQSLLVPPLSLSIKEYAFESCYPLASIEFSTENTSVGVDEAVLAEFRSKRNGEKNHYTWQIKAIYFLGGYVHT